MDKSDEKTGAFQSALGASVRAADFAKAARVDKMLDRKDMGVSKRLKEAIEMYCLGF